MQSVLEVSRVVKQQSGKVGAWHNGRFVSDVYFTGPTLHGSPAKYFVRSRDNSGKKRVRVVQGTVYQNSETGVVYFLSR